jgi:phosphatidate phosphatase APP1
MQSWLTRLRGPHIVLPYLGFGTATRLTVCGRVLEDEGFRPAQSADRRWRNLVAMYKRFESDEVPGARVRARHGAAVAEAVADREGYFSVELESAPAGGEWRKVDLELLAPRAGAAATAQVLVPPASARFGVISDIDDTVVQSHVTRKLRMVVSLALSNARTRKPFEGVAAFYRALQAGAGAEGNPIFYVSKSPWNLYVPLVDFLQVQGIPLGPLMLRDFGMHMARRRGNGKAPEALDHKARSIDRVLETYPAMPFVLIGDSGEHDPEIYRGVVRRWPGRVRAIYIRSVNRDPARLAAIDRLIEEVRPTGCQLVLAPDSEFAAAHAAGEGLISPAALQAIRRDKARDAGGSRAAAARRQSRTSEVGSRK